MEIRTKESIRTIKTLDRAAAIVSKTRSGVSALSANTLKRFKIRIVKVKTNMPAARLKTSGDVQQVMLHMVQVKSAAEG